MEDELYYGTKTRYDIKITVVYQNHKWTDNNTMSEEHGSKIVMDCAT